MSQHMLTFAVPSPFVMFGKEVRFLYLEFFSCLFPVSSKDFGYMVSPDGNGSGIVEDSLIWKYQ